MRPTCVAILAALTAPAALAGHDVREGISATYACAGGAELLAAYINATDGMSYVVVGFDGKLIPMKAGPTGSGVHYLSLDGSALVWHTKGKEGFLARDDANQTTLVGDCITAD